MPPCPTSSKRDTRLESSRSSTPVLTLGIFTHRSVSRSRPTVLVPTSPGIGLRPSVVDDARPSSPRTPTQWRVVTPNSVCPAPGGNRGGRRGCFRETLLKGWGMRVGDPGEIPTRHPGSGTTRRGSSGRTQTLRGRSKSVQTLFSGILRPTGGPSPEGPTDSVTLPPPSVRVPGACVARLTQSDRPPRPSGPAKLSPTLPLDPSLYQEGSDTGDRLFLPRTPVYTTQSGVEDGSGGEERTGLCQRGWKDRKNLNLTLPVVRPTLRSLREMIAFLTLKKKIKIINK